MLMKFHDRPIPSPVQRRRPFPKPNKHRKKAATANAVPPDDFEDHGDDVEEDDRPIPSPVQTKRPFPKPNKHRKNAATANAVPSVDFEDHEDDAEEDVPILPLHTERPSSDYHQKGFTIPPPIMEVVEGVDYDELDEGCGDGTCDTDYDSDDLD
ncbi:hypothetical protein MPER_06608 [Moniliophthora perniciosa FA553]|nr:hypothetical protein MPER_06608 [Moniliophthora perniciosa FA553]